MRIATLVLSVFWVTLCHYAQASDLPIEEIKLPPGFKIELLARVENARQMALGTKGTLFVGSMQAVSLFLMFCFQSLYANEPWTIHLSVSLLVAWSWRPKYSWL